MINDIWQLAKMAYHERINGFNRNTKLEWVVFEVTSRCNSKCMHCNIWKRKKKTKELTPGEIEKIFSHNIFKTLSHILITGGEAFLRDDLLDVILRTHKVLPEVEFTLSTNGLLPYRVIEVVKSLVANSIKITVGISMDGIGAKHDKIRGVKGNFEKVVYLIDQLKEIRNENKTLLEIAAGHSLSTNTYDSLIETYNFTKELGIHFLTQLCEEFDYYSNIGYLAAVDKKKLLNEICKLPPSIHNEILIYAIKNGKPLKFNCYSMKTFLLLRSNGDVAPCLKYCNDVVCNVLNDQINVVLDSNEADKIMSKIECCQGCSNTWATSLSLKKDFIPFWGPMVKYKFRQITNRIN